MASRAVGRLLGWIAFIFLLAIPVGTYAAPGSSTTLPKIGAEESVDETTTRISVVQNGRQDEAIADRLTGIFHQLNGLEGIRVSVRSGVVRLTVPALDPAEVERAEQVALRVDGVVAVESEISPAAAADSLDPVFRRLSTRVREVLGLLPLIGLALALVTLFWVLGRVLAGATSFWARVTSNIFLADLLATSARLLVALVGVVLALEILGATTLLGALLGSAGLVGLAIGFAVKDTVDNYVSSLMLSIRQPFRANDHVVIGEREGRVVRLTSRATILMTLDGNHLRIPNSTVFRAEILNFTRNPERRFEFTLGVDANDDAGEAMEVGIAQMRELWFLLRDPPPTARLERIGDSNIELCFLGWIDQTQTDWFKARSATIRAVKAVLEARGFGLPEPIYRLRFDSDNPLQIKRSVDAGEKARKETRRPLLPQPTPDQNVAVDNEIKKKVNQERAASEQKDMLDAGRPIE